ncbi:siderophore biosynthesis acetylase AceI [Trichophyton equinum CBS 127.97]|uniref:Siderophore biosynthesis acetylase AceI n=1 Tax=Trichophyton equinum (strain ATCC MYA-4606 / CBS 127.97) TaxID=559882 RepID=F2Q5F8_TRIEC|nr:siderophore biosynthesis acetylase AceI [Trichophyton equinum CBS 127.97]
MSDFSLLSQERAPLIRIPEPQNATYEIVESTPGSKPKSLRVQLCGETGTQSKPQKVTLHHSCLMFTDLSLEDASRVPPDNNNSPWARAKRSPLSNMSWEGNDTPTVGQIWIVVYAILTVHPELEVFRITLNGAGSDILARQLEAVGLVIAHPAPSAPPGQPVPASDDYIGQLVVLRRSFWQGAGSPFGPRPIWVAGADNRDISPSFESAFPPRALDYSLTTKFPTSRIHTTHPIRPAKPTPGSTIYSRYIPHLKETFSMVALDWTNEEHVNLFHVWQNDPRVAAGWNETGTLEQHRAYLKNIHEDSHQFPVLGKFDDTFFAYYEIYWAKEDAIGPYYGAGDFDRGRHFLVGDARFRGPHRVKAWHTCLTHYMFLDDPRTNLAVGEPRATGVKVLAYDQANGYHINKLIDLPHKRAALIMCPREKFFQDPPFEYKESS